MWVNFCLPGITRQNKQFSVFLEISETYPTIWSTPPFQAPFPSSTCFCLTLSFFSQQCSFLHRTQTHSSILEVCILSANHGALMLCISTNDRAVGVEPASMSDSATCLSLYPFSFFYHLPFSFSFSPSPSLLIYYTNEAEVRIWHKQTPILEGIQNPTTPTYTY